MTGPARQRPMYNNVLAEILQRDFVIFKANGLETDALEGAKIWRLGREEKLGPAAIARRLGIDRASGYQLLGKGRLRCSASEGGNADQT